MQEDLKYCGVCCFSVFPRCKSWHTDATLLLLKLNNNGYRVEIAALDEAVDHYGKQMIYILMSPFADYQREFLDRVRIGTIRHYQVGGSFYGQVKI